MNRHRAVIIAGLALAGLAIFVVTPAYASSASNAPAPDENPYGHLNSVKVNEPAPAGTTVIKAEDLEQQGALSPSSNVAVTDILVADVNRSINSVTWDSERDVLHFYVNDASDELRGQIAKILPESQVWDILPAARSITELETAIEKIAADPASLPAGLTFVSGTPAADGSSITIGVEGSTAAAFRSVAPPASIADIPATIVEESRADPISRIRNIAPVIAGGYMTGPSSAGNRACSTGFPVLRVADSQFNMISADHCTDQQGVDWKWGTGTHSVGDSTFVAPGGTDLELFIGPDSLSTWVFAGNNNDAASVLPIRGYAAPVGGNNVCYSGSRSGIVCSNVLESADTYNCVNGIVQCYWTRWSTQSAGTPAAGNGDSGGPVIIPVLRASDNTVGAYGVGVISMIANGTATCTGDAGSATGRKCSTNVGFAPLSRWAASQSTHNLVYTTS